MSVDFAVIPVPGDGDCFYHAVIKGLGLDIHPMALREQVVNVLEKDADLFDDLVTEWKDFGLVRYTDRISVEDIRYQILHYREWATPTVIHILAKLYSARLVVFQNIGGKFYGEVFPAEYKLKDGEKKLGNNAKTVYILHRGNHFDLLERLDKKDSLNLVDNKTRNTQTYNQPTFTKRVGGGKNSQNSQQKNSIRTALYGLAVIATFLYNI